MMAGGMVYRLLLVGLIGLGAVPVSAAEVEGRLEWMRRVELSTPVSGVVREVPLRAGQRVAAGDLLLSLDTRSFKAAVTRGEADVRRLRAAMEEARRELERTQELYDRTLLAEHDLQLAKIADTTADSSFRAAQATLDQAKLDLEYAQIRAPFAGLVLRVDAEAGQSVVNRLQSTPLVVLAEAGRMRVRLLLTQDAAAGLTPGQAVPVAVSGRRYQGEILSIGLEPQAGTEPPRYPLDVVLSTGEDILRAGQPARVTLP